MPIAAVPAYLGQHFKDASPGMRFGMYLALWGVNRRSQAPLWRTYDIDFEVRGQDKQEREVQRENKVVALANATHLNDRDRQTAAALLARQRQAFSASVPMEAALCLEALATSPFATGLGNEHPLENGFAFLNPYGLPYLPGSGIKGVLRQAARELASGNWGDACGWSAAKAQLLVARDRQIAMSPIDVLFGLESDDGETRHVRGALRFWDVIPQIKGDRLTVDIMTPHQTHYYQQKSDRGAGGSVAPHDSGQPIPISFLTVPPGSAFVFHVHCDLTHLRRLAPELEQDARWKTLLGAAFGHAFAWLGFGAKTAVGYGAMCEDPEARRREAARQQAEADAAHRAQAEAQRQAELANMSPIEREIREFLDHRTDKNQPELSALMAALKKGQWSGDAKVAVAGHVKKLMQASGRWKESSQKKNPGKDKDYQDTLSVMTWLENQ